MAIITVYNNSKIIYATIFLKAISLSVDPNMRFGKPCITNTRITIADILSYLASGMSNEEIIADFPEIKNEHIIAALTFAANREQAIKTIINDKTAA